MQWIADRFFYLQETWWDAASGRRVRMHVEPAGSDDIAWDDDCARLARLRHPLLNTLLDFGPAPGGRRFEAYEGALALPGGRRHVPPTRGGRTTERGRGHEGWDRGRQAHLNELSALLASQHISATEARLGCIRRRHPAGHGSERRLAVVLQPRATLQVLEDALDRMSPPGPALIDVCGAPGMGLRTFRVMAARLARLRGFVPLGCEVIAHLPHVADTLLDRHVCILDDRETRVGPATAAFIARIARTSTRRHVVIRLSRAPDAGRAALALETFDSGALVRMVAAGPEMPERAVLLDAARAAAGNPGSFLAALDARYTSTSGSMVVHEAQSPYVAGERTVSSEPLPIAGRLLGASLRAVPRAAALAGSGRHAVAARVLERALRVLDGRQRNQDAARCALALGTLALDRGAVTAATRHYLHAGSLAPQGALSIEASVGHGVALVDGRRLLEAEAVLRGACASADALGEPLAMLAPVAALVRCLYWQERYHDALAAAAGHREDAPGSIARVRLLSAVARCEARLGRTATAVATAREAQRASATCSDARAVASAELALAEALEAAGDAPGAGAALARVNRLARSAHLPLFRIRAALLAPTARDGAASHLRTATRAQLPALLAGRIEALRAAAAARRSRVEPVSELESLLDLTQRAADDRAALEQICKAVAERLGAGAVAVVAADDRILAMEGRPWRHGNGIGQVIVCGTRVLPDACREPREAAEPVRYGGEVVAALACRWTLGAPVDREGAVMVLRAAALSAAAPVRALLDAAVPPPPPGWGDLLGESPPTVALREAVLRAARAPFPVLVEGESGSGKELVARAIHRLGPRRDRKFCALNCAALTDDLVEAELFGHTRGAFTGAMSDRAGLFEEGDGGTVFLDEVGELSARAQAKLLRVVQEGEVRRVGENMPRRVDVRIVAATNRRLEEEVTAGRFRVDLRFRLDVVRISVPPLRDRPTDLPLLASHFWREASARVGSQATLTTDALAALARYDWPGNVRELQNVIAWIAVHSPRRGRIGPSALPRHVAQATAPQACTFETAREEFERRFIRAALAGANGKRARAADALGITRQGLAKMMRRLRIEAP